ncbi:hypothetical protein D3C72_2058500 [compost metagenome]
MRGDRAQQQGVAIGLGPRHGIRAQHAARAALVLDHHGLAERRAQFLRDQAAQDVGRAAGGKWHHQCDGLGARPIVGGMRGAGAKGGNSKNGGHTAQQGKCLQSCLLDVME